MGLFSGETKEPEPLAMLEWITQTFQMSKSSLAWMFQVHPSTIQSWLLGNPISRQHRMKIRKSYYFLTGKQDPYAGLAYCESCQAWKESSEFIESSILCSRCRKGSS